MGRSFNDTGDAIVPDVIMPLPWTRDDLAYRIGCIEQPVGRALRDDGGVRLCADVSPDSFEIKDVKELRRYAARLATHLPKSAEWGYKN